MRRAFKRIRKNLRALGSDQLTIAEYAAKLKIQSLNVGDITSDDLESEFDYLHTERKRATKTFQIELALLGGIALYVFGVGTDILIGTISLQITEKTAAAVLFLFAFLNILNYSFSEDISERKALIILILKARPDLDPSGLKLLKTLPNSDVSQRFNLELRAGRVDISPAGALLAAFRIVVLFAALAGVIAIIYLPITATWAVGNSLGWDLIHKLLFGFVIIGLFARLVLSPAYDALALRFVDPQISAEFWENVEVHGFDVALSVLEDRVEQK